MKTKWGWRSALVGVGILVAGLLYFRMPSKPASNAPAGAARVDVSLQERPPFDPNVASSKREAAHTSVPETLPASTEAVGRLDAVVRGRVLSDGGTSLIGARITLLRGMAVIAGTDSLEGGRYELVLPDLPCGAVELSCEAPGHRDERLENVVVPGHYDFALRTAGYAACGSVIGDRFADPIPGAAVWLWDERGREELAKEVSDENGRFAFTRLSTGLYRLSAAAPGYLSVFEGLLVAEGQEEQDVTIRLGWSDRPVLVQVTNRDTSMPVEGALVTATLGESYRTDAGGTFQHPALSKGAMLTITADGFCQERYLLLPDDPAPVVELEPALTFGLRVLVPERLRPIEVDLQQQPPRGLPARNVRCSLEPGREEELVALAAGVGASLEVVAIIRGPRIETTTCSARRCADPSLLDELPLCVPLAGETLQGMVRDEAGRPVASATVAVFGSGGFEERSRILSPSRAVLRSCERRATSDSAGSFVVRGLPVGLLDLVVGSPGFVVTVLPVQVPRAKELEIVLLAREGEPGDLTGRFLDADEKPLSRAIVRAIDPDGYVSEVMSNGDGRFTFPRVQPGSYKLGVSVLGGTETRSWTCKQTFQPGKEDILLRAPWTVP